MAAVASSGIVGLPMAMFIPATSVKYHIIQCTFFSGFSPLASSAVSSVQSLPCLELVMAQHAALRLSGTAPPHRPLCKLGVMWLTLTM